MALEPHKAIGKAACTHDDGIYIYIFLLFCKGIFMHIRRVIRSLCLRITVDSKWGCYNCDWRWSHTMCRYFRSLIDKLRTETIA